MKINIPKLKQETEKMRATISELSEISRNKAREIGCKSKVDVISKLYGGTYSHSPGLPMIAKQESFNYI
jgi:hypothetical protein